MRKPLARTIASTAALLALLAAPAAQAGTAQMYLLTYSYGSTLAAEFKVQNSWSPIAPSCPSGTSNCKTQLIDSLPDPSDSLSAVGTAFGPARYISITAAPWGITGTIDKCLKTAGCDVSPYYANAKIYYYDLGSQQLTANGATPGSGTGSQSSSECVFNALEKSYPAFLSPAGGATKLAAPYSYRQYSSSQAYLAVSSSDNHVYYIGQPTGNSLADLGPLSNLKSLTGCP